MYLKKRHSKWWAFHDIPRSLRKIIGAARFAASLDTPDKEVARRRAAPLEIRWRAEIARARHGTPDDPIVQDAAYWQRVLSKATTDDEREIVRDMIADIASERADDEARRSGVVDVSDPEYEAARDRSGATRFAGLALGTLMPLDHHLDEFLATLTSEKKSKDQKRSSILKFQSLFPLAQDISRKGLQQYINTAATEGMAPATIRRQLSELRTYWNYLASLEIVPRYPSPFDGLTIPTLSGKQQAQTSRRGFEPAEVVTILAEAQRRGDAQLAALIELAMYTGARIEELCALPLARVSKTAFEIEDAKSKAGWRKVPIHKALVPLIKRLRASSTDGFLLSGLSGSNKYGDRSPGIGKRFGRLKAEMGFPATKVFHSIRKTVSTLLEQAGVPENVAADILGHDKPTMTYGVYAEGSSIEQRVTAVASIKYPSQRRTPRSAT